MGKHNSQFPELRWNGWGYTNQTYPLSSTLLSYLEQHLGPADRPPEVERASVRVPPPYPFRHPHASLDTSDDTRLTHALGQSFPDLTAKRFGQIRRFPDAVSFPERDGEVRDLLSWAGDSNVQIIPFGGGTGVVGGVNPSDSDDRPVVTLAMGRQNALRHLDEISGLATFGAGTTGPLVEAQLRSYGFTLGHYPQSFEHASLGGWVATRSVGQQSLGYGRIEALFAGGTLEAPAGKWRLPAFPASAAGPDLRQLVLGSEGRLGVITEVVIRVRSLPEAEAFYGAMFPDWESGISAARAVTQAALPLSLVRLSNPTETETFLQLSRHEQQVRALRAFLRWRDCGPDPCLMIFGLTGKRALVRMLRREMAALVRSYRGVWLTRLVGKQWEKSRFRSAYLRDALWEKGYAVDTLETAVSWSQVPAAAESILAALKGAVTPVLPMVHLSHLYPDGASLYFTFLFRVGRTAEETLSRWRALKGAGTQAVLAAGGTISHQHGVGVDHRPYLVVEKGDLGITALDSARRIFDPAGIMNPGKLA